MKLRFATLVLVITAGSLLAAVGDRKGSADYPLIGRFENSVIAYYDVKDFDEHTIYTSGIVSGSDGGPRTVEGKTYRIAYKAPKQVLVVDSLGRSPSGKLDYNGLRERAKKELAQSKVD